MNIVNIRIELANPFDRWDLFKNLGCISGRLFKHKAWELEHTYYSPMLADIDLVWNKHTDHAGLAFSVGLLGYGISFRTYDTRHWNYDLNRWEEWDYSEYTQTNS
jgi:hypothetical protein